MAFNCSVALANLDVNCLSKNNGGIKRVVLGLKEDLSLSLDTSEENVLLGLTLSEFVVFEHNKKDGATYFKETKSTEQGNGVVNTEILVRLPAIDSKINKIEQMSYRNDIVCILYHNNDSVTVSGWKRGLDMNYSASSGSSISNISYVDVTLFGESWYSSLATTDESIIALGTTWASTSTTWSNTNLIWS